MQKATHSCEGRFKPRSVQEIPIFHRPTTETALPTLSNTTRVPANPNFTLSSLLLIFIINDLQRKSLWKENDSPSFGKQSSSIPMLAGLIAAWVLLHPALLPKRNPCPLINPQGIINPDCMKRRDDFFQGQGRTRHL